MLTLTIIAQTNQPINQSFHFMMVGTVFEQFSNNMVRNSFLIQGNGETLSYKELLLNDLIVLDSVVEHDVVSFDVLSFQLCDVLFELRRHQLWMLDFDWVDLFDCGSEGLFCGWFLLCLGCRNLGLSLRFCSWV